MTADEQSFLACCYDAADNIDRAVAAGLTRQHFTDYAAGAQWQLLCDQRTRNAATTPADIYSAAVAAGTLDQLGGLAGITACSPSMDNLAFLNGPALLSVLLTRYARREAWKLATRAKELVEDDNVNLADVAGIAEDMAGVCAGKVTVHRTLDDIDAELEKQVQDAKAGKVDVSKHVMWGIPKCDRYMLPIKPHETVLICARPSVGKSSMLTHLAHHNLMRGLRVAYFSLETSDRAVFSQMAAQRSGQSLTLMQEWMPHHHADFKKVRDEMKATKRLLIFDNLMTLDAITAKCRMLAGSFKPDVVFWDYLGLTGVAGASQYERITTVSNALIGIRKGLGCPLIVANQLNRSTTDGNAEPTSAALRDSGHLEQDAHRIVMLHWKNNTVIDATSRDYKILQTKCRDGVVTAVDGITFHAPTTRFYENA